MTTNSSEKRDPMSFVVDLFIGTVFTSITVLLIYRIIWIIKTINLARLGVAAADMESPIPLNFYHTSITTGDPIIYLLLVISIIFFSIITSRRSLLTFRPVMIDLTLRILVVYSFIMIIIQIVFLAIIGAATGRPWVDFITETSISINEEVIISVSDPHYIGLFIGLSGLIAVGDLRLWENLILFIQTLFKK